MLHTETEVELKYCLRDPAAIETLLGVCTWQEVWLRQTNHYIDDAVRSLRAAGVMMRAREFWFPPGTPAGASKPPVTLTAKRRVATDGPLFTSEERAQVLSLDDWQDLARKPSLLAKGPLFDWLRATLDFGPLAVIGHTVTKRQRVLSGPHVLELDHTTYPDGSSDLELECETRDAAAARTHIEGLLRLLEIPFSPSTEGKFARFLARGGA